MAGAGRAETETEITLQVCNYSGYTIYQSLTEFIGFKISGIALDKEAKQVWNLELFQFARYCVKLRESEVQR